jgi:hypothetical protein
MACSNFNCNVLLLKKLFLHVPTKVVEKSLLTKRVSFYLFCEENGHTIKNVLLNARKFEFFKVLGLF